MCFSFLWGCNKNSLIAKMLTIAMFRSDLELALRSDANIALFHIWLLYSLFSLLLYLRTENYRPFQLSLLTPVHCNVFLFRQRLPGCNQAALSNTNQREEKGNSPIAETWRHKTRKHIKRKKKFKHFGVFLQEQLQPRWQVMWCCELCWILLTLHIIMRLYYRSKFL